MAGLTYAGTVGLDAQGHLEVFACGTDGALWTIQQTSPNNGWGGWQSLGAPPGLVLGSPPVVATNLGGLLEVFVKGSDNAVWHTWQNIAGVWPGSGWHSLGGSITGIPAVGSNWDHRLEVFAVGAGSAVYHNWQNIGGVWSGWWPLGGTSKGYPAVALNHALGAPLDGCLEVFVIGNDFPWPQMHHIWQLTKGGGWSSWASLGGGFPNTYVSYVGQNQDGHLEVFALGSDVLHGDNVTHAWQSPPATTHWSGFGPLGNPPPGAINPQVAQNHQKALPNDVRLEVFGVARDSAVWHNWQTSENNGWSGWATLGVPGPGTEYELCIGNNQDGRLEVFSIGKDGNLWHIWQPGWSKWWCLGSPGAPGDSF